MSVRLPRAALLFGIPLVGCSLGSVAAARQGQTEHVFPTFSYDVSLAPRDVTFADLDQDGVAEMIASSSSDTSSSTNGDVRVFKGNGDGTFALPPVVLSAGKSPYQAVLPDLDGDGDLDLAVCNSGNPSTGQGSLLIFRNDGTALVSSGTIFPGQKPQTISSADFDSDGRADVATGNWNSNNVAILLGHGDGTFAAASIYPVGDSPAALAIADLDGDGVEDIAVADAVDGKLYRLSGNGNGTFASLPTLAVGGTLLDVRAADLDVNGTVDLAVANASANAVAVLLGSGGGAFASPAFTPVEALPYGLDVDDLDGDGLLDLAVANRNACTVSLLRGVGGGVLTPSSVVVTAREPISVELADLDHDGRLDLGVAEYGAESGSNPDAVSVHLGVGNGEFEPRGFRTLTAPEFSELTDVDGDGKLDLVVCDDGASAVSIHRGDGNGNFAAGVVYASGQPHWVSTGDLDGDGSVDVFTANGSSFVGAGSDDLSILLNHGNGTFAPEVRLPVGPDPWAARAADFDGDGTTDLAAVHTGSNELWLLLGAGDGTTFTHTQSVPVANFPIELELSDIDVDGDLDALVPPGTIPANSTAILRWQSGSGFVAAPNLFTGIWGRDLELPDIDGDGDPDILLSHNYTASNGVSRQFGNGDGTFAGVTYFSFACCGFDVEYADVDLDGIEDIVQCSDAGVSYRPGLGAGEFGALAEYAYAGTAARNMHAADLNGDGADDLVLLNFCGWASVLINHGKPQVTLSGTPVQISIALGGTQVFQLHAGASQAGKLYMLGGTLSGTAPGFALAGFTIPLNIDSYSLLTLGSPNHPPLANSLGVLDGAGDATASFSIPPGISALAGQTAHHAFAVLDPSTLLAGVSNPVAVQFVH